MKKLFFVLIAFLIFPPLIHAASIDPQYIFVRKNNTNCNPADCSQLWDMNNPNLDYYPGITDVYNKVGTHGTDQRKLGIGVLVFYNGYTFENISASLQTFLTYAKVHTVPLFITLDGFQWWDKRPDLWNWWDPNQPGYNPNNKNNVEWTCPDSSCAIKKSWRNWGSELEVKPHPNLASRTFIDANKDRLRVLIPIIVNWYNGLSDDQKWLLGGISLGNETDIGANYYVPGQTLGYAAITTLNLPGGVTPSNIDEAIKRYTEELDKFALSLGIPRNKIFNHAHPWHVMTAVTGSGYPGWSLYGGQADNPANLGGLDAAISQANSIWASPEWLTYATDTNGWVTALKTTLNYRNNKFLNIANWEEIRDKQYVLDALRTVLNENLPAPSPTPAIPSPTPSYIPEDINRDGKVDIFDYNLLVTDFGKTGAPGFSPADLDTNGKVDIFDYNMLVGNFGKTQ